MKVALFKHVEYGFEGVFLGSFEDSDEYVRVTEYVDIEFTRLPDSETVKKSLAIIDKAADAVREELGRKLDGLDRRRQELLALPGVDNA